jgi:ribosomal protein S18 acetylase RimI-like enzyme
MIPVLDQTKEEVMGERNQDCYYLVYIGTKPNAQGRGYAGKLIRDMVAKVLQLMSTCPAFHH